MNKILYELATGALIGIGVLGVPAKIFHFENTAYLDTLGLSPAEGPFNVVSFPFQYPKSGEYFQCPDQNGKTLTVQIDGRIRRGIGGPHRHSIPYIWAEFDNFRKRSVLAQQIMHYGWCSGGPLAMAAGCDSHSAQISLMVRGLDGEVIWSDIIKCKEAL